MRRGIVALALAIGAQAGTGSASATQITLKMSSAADPAVKALGTLDDGTVGYGWRFTEAPVQVYTAEIVADDGQPVLNTCLAGGARIELLDMKRAIRGGVTCTGTEGTWQIVLSGTQRVRTPTVLTAQLLTATSTSDGRAMSPTSSNKLAALVAAKITDTSPDRVTGTTFPITGYVTMPKVPRSLGKVLLQEKRTEKWVTLQTRKTDAGGTYKFVVPYGVRGKKTFFRVRFVPAKNSLWLPSSQPFTITWI